MTVDGKIHFNHTFRYIYLDALACTGSEYLMIGKKYLTDDDGVMYPMENIISCNRATMDIWIPTSLIFCNNAQLLE